MSTVYTLNGKVLKNAANDKWLAKKEAPAGFVMNASNAIVTWQGGTCAVAWEAPSYPDNYDGNGKHYSITNNTSAGEYSIQTGLMYASSATGGGPAAINDTVIKTIGTSTGTMNANPSVSMFGQYLGISLTAASEEAVRTWLANVTITILDP